MTKQELPPGSQQREKATRSVLAELRAEVAAAHTDARRESFDDADRLRIELRAEARRQSAADLAAARVEARDALRAAVRSPRARSKRDDDEQL